MGYRQTAIGVDFVPDPHPIYLHYIYCSENEIVIMVLAMKYNQCATGPVLQLQRCYLAHK